MHILPSNYNVKHDAPSPLQHINLNKIDADTPIEAITLLLYSLHEQSLSLQHAQTQNSLHKIDACFETRQQKTLELIESQVQKQLDLCSYKETAFLGGMIHKTLTAAMSVMAVSSAAATTGAIGGIEIGGITRGLAVTTALFTAADAVIHIVQYAQKQRDYSFENIVGKNIAHTFSNVLANFSPISPTKLSSYVNDMIINNMIILLNSAIFLATGKFYHVSHFLPSIIEGAYAPQIGHTQATLANITAEQKINLALQDILKQNFSMLQKGIRKQHQALEEFITSTADALKQQFETTQYLNKHIA